VTSVSGALPPRGGPDLNGYAGRVSPRILTTYRVLAYTTGVILLIFTVEIIAKYGFGVEGLEWVAIVHGWVYMAYFLVTVYLGIQLRWTWRWMVPVVLAGTIPLMSFVAERKVVGRVRQERPDLVRRAHAAS
jgi:integral membrane protein